MTGSWTYFSLTANATSYIFTVEETDGSGGNIWVYSNLEDAPEQTDFLESDTGNGSLHVIHHTESSYDTRTVIIGVMGSPFGGEGVPTGFKVSAFAF